MKVHCSVCGDQISVSSEGLFINPSQETEENKNPFDIFELKNHLALSLPEWSFSIETNNNEVSLHIKCAECNKADKFVSKKKGKKAKKIIKKIKKLLRQLSVFIN